MKLASSSRVLQKYSRDRSVYKVVPKAVAFPKDENEVQQILEHAQKTGLAITPRGGGVGLSGSAIGNGIVVDVSKHMNRLLAIDTTTKIQAGMKIKDLKPRLEKAGYMLVSSPLYEECTIGGNVSTNSVGPRSMKYGLTTEQLSSVRGVLADGTIIDTADKLPQELEKKILGLQKELKKDKKLVAYLKKRSKVAGGYNLRSFLEHKEPKDILTHLVAGSVGTLMVLTEVRMDLPKYRPMHDIYLLYFNDYKQLQAALDKLLQLKPASLEYMGRDVIDLLHKSYRRDCVGAIIAGFESHRNLIAVEAQEIRRVEEEERPMLWRSRQQSLPKLEASAKKQGLSAPSGIDDLTMDPKDFSKVMLDVDAYAKKKGVKIASFGHIGVGSIHLRAFLDMEKHPEQLDKVSKDIFRIVHKYGGTLVGEHDAGRCRSLWLEKESRSMYVFMKKVKDALDPEGLLNPNIMFDLEPITEHIDVSGV